MRYTKSPFEETGVEKEFGLELSASDVDGDSLVFDASNGEAEILVNGTTLTITPPSDYNGSDEVTVTVTDGYLERYTFNSATDMVAFPLLNEM